MKIFLGFIESCHGDEDTNEFCEAFTNKDLAEAWLEEAKKLANYNSYSYIPLGDKASIVEVETDTWSKDNKVVNYYYCNYHRHLNGPKGYLGLRRHFCFKEQLPGIFSQYPLFVSNDKFSKDTQTFQIRCVTETKEEGKKIIDDILAGYPKESYDQVIEEDRGA